MLLLGSWCKGGCSCPSDDVMMMKSNRQLTEFRIFPRIRIFAKSGKLSLLRVVKGFLNSPLQGLLLAVFCCGWGCLVEEIRFSPYGKGLLQGLSSGGFWWAPPMLQGLSSGGVLVGSPHAPGTQQWGALVGPPMVQGLSSGGLWWAPPWSRDSAVGGFGGSALALPCSALALARA